MKRSRLLWGAALVAGLVAPRNWGLEAFAVCANPATTRRIQQAQSALDSTSPKSANVLCTTAGTQAHGVGVRTLSRAHRSTAGSR